MNKFLTKKRIWLMFLFFIILVPILFYCISGELDSGKCKNCNVIVISLTNLRYDHMSSNGYFRHTTPNLDSLSSESVVFDNAFSHSSWTLPEGISIFTSLYPYRHKVMNRFDGSVLSKDIPSLIDILNSRGYKTAGFTGGFDYDPRFGLTNRFDEYQGCGEGEGVSITTLGYGKIECALSKAISWIKSNKDTKFLVQVQGYDAHCPFSQKDGSTYDKSYWGGVDFSNCLWTFDKTEPVIKNGKKYYRVFSSDTGTKDPIFLGERDIEHLLALYDESITDSDKLIGSFLDEIKSMGLWDDTIIVFTSEHGDMFGKDGRFMRGGPIRGTFYDDVVHIPLIFKIPGVKPGRFSQLAGHIDVMPTILDTLGVNKPLGLEGKSLLPAIFEGRDVNKYVFAGSEYHPGLDNMYFSNSTRIESVRSKEWKLIEETDISGDFPKTSSELYNLKQDGGESNNLINSERAVFDKLNALLREWSEKIRNENKN